MNKKEVSEIKKQFTVKHAVVDAISMTYVTEEKDILFSKKEYLHQMPEEEAGQYLDLLKKRINRENWKKSLHHGFSDSRWRK